MAAFSTTTHTSRATRERVDVTGEGTLTAGPCGLTTQGSCEGASDPQRRNLEKPLHPHYKMDKGRTSNKGGGQPPQPPHSIYKGVGKDHRKR